eukprot:791494-Ditylum_brightwellii.AAC.1
MEPRELSSSQDVTSNPRGYRTSRICSAPGDLRLSYDRQAPVDCRTAQTGSRLSAHARPRREAHGWDAVATPTERGTEP